VQSRGQAEGTTTVVEENMRGVGKGKGWAMCMVVVKECQRLTCQMEDGAVLPVVSLTQSVTTRVEDTRVLGITTSGRACAWGSGVVEI
jgi:hypothetical protein